MSAARDQILQRLRAATSSLPAPAKHPEYAPALAVSKAGEEALAATDLTAAFARQWQSVHGRWLTGWADLAAQLQAEKPEFGYCSPLFLDALRAAWPEAPVTTEFDRARINDYAFGITPAWGAIAETGTCILTDRDPAPRLAALAPWVHVAVIPPERIFATVGEALAQRPQDPSIVLVTGPSKTADIEGILIEGVHGPGIQMALVAAHHAPT